LPDALWRAAAEAAREHGVFRTGQVLHLEYGKLKRRMNSPRGKTGSPIRLVELGPVSTLGGNECVIELEGARGKLRFRLQGSRAEDIAGLTRAAAGDARRPDADHRFIPANYADRDGTGAAP
jgi:hypothetical protein